MATKEPKDPVARMKVRVWKQGKELGYVREMGDVYAVVFDVNKATAFDYLVVGVVMRAMQTSPLPGAKPPPLTFSILVV
jgi:hypothetical protein